MKTPMKVVYAAWQLLGLLERSDRGREATVKRVCQLAYLLGRPPWDTEETPPELVDAVRENAAGRALDLGCGTGTNSIYLAQHGWDVVGVDMVKSALRQARVKARRAGVRPQFLQGDVTRLDQLSTGTDFSLFFDLGCYSGIPLHRRNAYAAGITARAKAGAQLLLFGFAPGALLGEASVTADEVRTRFTAWELIEATPGTSALQTWWFTLRRT
jgi:SAM-dependent methyltransferase